TVVIEDVGIKQFEFRLIFSASPVFLDQSAVWKLRLWILVQILHVRVCRRAVEIEVVLLNIFAVVTFIAGQTEDPLFENRITLIPQSYGKTEKLTAIGNPCNPIFIPAIHTRAGLIV